MAKTASLPGSPFYLRHIFILYNGNNSVLAHGRDGVFIVANKNKTKALLKKKLPRKNKMFLTSIYTSVLNDSN